MATEPLPASLASYKPSSNEKEAYDYLFKKADTESLGVLTGELAVPFFSHSSLPPILLGEIWQICDVDNVGFLSPERFGVACRLIGHAQEEKRKKGVPQVKQEWVGQPGPFPTFKGYSIPSHLSPPTSNDSPTSSSISQRAAPPAPASRLTAQNTGTDINQIKQDDKTKYARLFAGANNGNLTGLLEGEKARDIFIKSNLPYETLGQIWNLADTHARGSLDLADFTIGMHLLQLVLNGQLSQDALPKVLDPKMYASAAGLNAPGTGGTSAAAAGAGVTPQSPLRQSSLPPRQVSSPPPPAATPRQPQFQPQPQAQNQGWKISQQEKEESDNWFSQLDANNKGVLEGEQAVGFFGQSGLGNEELAKIWDLSDITGSGNLNRDTFAVAMKLIREKVSNPSGFQLPDQLPLEYVPPSLRSDLSSSRAGSFPPPPQQMTQPQRDLLDLMGDDDSPSTPTPSSPPPPQAAASSFAPLQPQSTGPIQRSLSPQATGSSFQGLQGTVFPQNTGSRVISPQSTGNMRGGSSGFQNDFNPSHSTSIPQQQPPPPAATSSSNFFDDNDLADTTSNLESLRTRSTQLEKEEQETSRSLESTSKTREELENEVEKVNEQIKALQEKVSTSRQQLESERNAVEDLKKREQDQKGVLSRARTELISSESDLSGLKMEKSELEGEFLRDKEEVREVKKRLTMVEEEKRILRGEIEKLKKEGRREKGLGAIARKQLVSAESDRGKLEEEFEHLKTAPIETPVVEEPPRSIQQPQPALAVPLPPSTVTSPTASLRSNNPFDKLNLANAGLSPQPTGQSTNSTLNPFPFASPSPTANSFAAAATPSTEQSRDISSPTPTSDVSAEDKTPNVQDSILPIASAAAGVVGAGALYALETAGSSITHALGVGSPTAEKKPEQEEEEKEPTETGNDEVDPFGVPAAQHAREETQSTTGGGAFDTPETTSNAGFGDDFGSNSFGDDFASAAHQPERQLDEDEKEETAQGTLGQVDNDAGFDEAFEELKPTESTAKGEEEPETVEGKLGDLNDQEGFDDAFKEFEPESKTDDDKDLETVSGTLGQVDQGAGFDDAFDELQEENKSEDKGKGKEVVRDDTSEEEDDVFAETNENIKMSPEEANKGEEMFIEHSKKTGEEEDEDDSSDDEGEGPEDLDRPSAFTRRSFDAQEPSTSVPAGSNSTSAIDSPNPLAKEGTSNSESGESYVHVSSSTAESSGILEEVDEPATISPLPVPTPVPAPIPTSTQRRAAPPPPSRSTAASIASPSLSTSEQPRDVTSSVPDDFDTGFDGTRLESNLQQPSTTMTTTDDSAWPSAQPTTSAAPPEDDFESSFADMSIQQPSTSSGDHAKESSQQGFDNFDDDFDFKPSFDGETTDPTPATGTEQKENFDEGAFADFDDSFAPAASAASTQPAQPQESVPSSSGPQAQPQKGFSFDESFGKFPFGGETSSSSTTTTTTAPPALAPPVASPPAMARMPSIGLGDARPDDSSDVKEICSMGFARSQAIEALAKYDHDLNRAINSLLG
ncbi:Ede1p [Sporobolomyces salmoneus]|uniref:Ede1p n=1 Tax=Sporobolomyces salmoneus TaxID=183962 RepID=UPI0031724F73